MTAALPSFLSLLLLFHAPVVSTAWIVDPNPRGSRSVWIVRHAIPDPDQVVDVDFERISETDTTKKNRSFPPADDDDDDDDDDDMTMTTNKPKNLLDLSLDSDPRWKSTRIPFCRGDEYIDGKLAFTVDLEGATYGIAVPFDDAVAILVEEGPSKDKTNEDGTTTTTSTTTTDTTATTTTYINPDDYDEYEDNQELMEIMAAQVQEQLGAELQLRKTPKVLTISGGLSQVTDQWEKKVLPTPASVEELLKTVSTSDQALEDEMAEFYDFMKKELGEAEFEKTLNEDLTDEDQELMKFFEVPGLSDMSSSSSMSSSAETMAGLEELVKSMADDLGEDGVVGAQKFDPNTEGVSLRLIGFDIPSGGKYNLVKLLQPFVLVGRYNKNDMGSDPSESDIRFELLTREEEQIVIPKLEEVCQSDLQAAGLSFDSSNE